MALHPLSRISIGDGKLVVQVIGDGVLVSTRNPDHDDDPTEPEFVDIFDGEVVGADVTVADESVLGRYEVEFPRLPNSRKVNITNRGFFAVRLPGGLRWDYTEGLAISVTRTGP